ncbi:MAG: GNAT family N-acetyltransferase [Pseudomonadota bacterium]
MSVTVDIPTIETDRLRLRAWRPADFDALAVFAMDEERARYRGGARADRAAAWAMMAAQSGDWALLGFGGVAIAARDDDTAIGMTGLWQPPSQPEPELFWSLFAGSEGQGFATEAATAMRIWAHGAGHDRLISLIHPDNTGSRGVAKRLGATHDGNAQLGGEPREIWRHPAPDQRH